jgi:hypothetical protein
MRHRQDCLCYKTPLPAMLGVPTITFFSPSRFFGLSGDSLMDWAAAKIPALQKEIPVVND